MRERLTKGDTDGQVIDFVVDRYGEFVLLKPRFNAQTALLWGFPVIILLIGGGALLVAFRRRRAAGTAPQPLSESEKRNFPACLTENRPTKPLETLRNFHLAEIER